MSTRPPRLKFAIPLAILYLIVHCACVAAFPPQAVLLTNLFQAVAVLLGIAACTANIWRSSRRRANALLLNWSLFTGGLILWLAGLVISAWAVIFNHITGAQAYFSDLFFFFYGVPVLLALSVPNESRRSRLFLWLDGIQVAVAGYLVYIEIFAVVPFTHQAAAPISLSRLVTTYNVENFVLAGAATLRLFACPPGTLQVVRERRFYGVVALYLWVYVLTVDIYNYLQTIQLQAATLYDPLIDLPFLVLAISVSTLPVFYAPNQSAHAAPDEAPRRLALFIDNASPIFFSFAMLALGVAVARNHFVIGISAIVLALIFYGLRATVLQGRYMQSQKALQHARDRLEELSLQDFLTGVANRRRFDQTLESEWHRAVRLRHPLSLLMIDVDYFKSINDRYGHRHGDECLAAIARALLAALPRSGDLLARYGGEEFAAILPGTDQHGVQAVALRMQQAVRDLNIHNETALGHFATVSIGIATCEFTHNASPGTLVEASDRALYQAKQLGRNRIEIASLTPISDPS